LLNGTELGLFKALKVIFNSQLLNF